MQGAAGCGKRDGEAYIRYVRRTDRCKMWCPATAYKKMIARHPCGTQSYSLPLLPSGPGGVRKSLLRRTRLSNRKISGGEGGIRTHGTLPHTRVPGVHLKPLGHLSSVFRTHRHAGRWGTTLQYLFPLAKNKMAKRTRYQPHSITLSTIPERCPAESNAHPLFRFAIKMAAVLTAFMPPFDRLGTNGEVTLKTTRN